jgi:hypothetical protein
VEVEVEALVEAESFALLLRRQSRCLDLPVSAISVDVIFDDVDDFDDDDAFDVEDHLLEDRSVLPVPVLPVPAGTFGKPDATEANAKVGRNCRRRPRQPPKLVAR